MEATPILFSIIIPTFNRRDIVLDTVTSLVATRRPWPCELIVVVDGKGMTHTNITEVDPGVPITIRDLKVHMLGKGDRYTLPTQDQQHK